MKPLRILHAPIIALYQPYLYTKGLKELGHTADYMVFESEQAKAFMQGKPDFDLKRTGADMLDREITRELEFLYYALDNYDIFHFHSNRGLFHLIDSFWRNSDEFKLLKKLGKKIVMSFWGWCEANIDGNTRFFDLSECDVCTNMKYGYCLDTDVVRTIKRSYQYSDAICCNGRSNYVYPQMLWVENAIDCNDWRPYSLDEIPEKYRLPPTKNIKIYHSFGNISIRDDVKGTAIIKAAVKQLQSEGYPVELMFFDKVPNVDIKYYQAQADLAVDQLYAGWHGSTAVECMAAGVPVLTYINPVVESYVPQDHPIINATIETIYDVIKDYISDKDRLKQIGKKSREYAKKYHHYTVVAKNLESIYLELVY